MSWFGALDNAWSKKLLESSELDLTSLTADIVSAYVANNALSGDRIPDLISSIYGALSKVSVQGVEPPKVELKPAVAIKKSITPDYLICLEDGHKFKSLKMFECYANDLKREAELRKPIRQGSAASARGA